MRKTAITLPVVVTGDRSPYPTVVTVEIDHHTASPKLLIIDPGLPRSCSRIARDATYTSRTTLNAV